MNTPTNTDLQKISIHSQTFLCENCGGTLKYDIQTEKFRCAACKTEKEVETISDSVQEYDFSIYAERERSTVAFEGLATVHCQNCGREITFDAGLVATICPMCGSTHVASCKQTAGIPPEGIVPFKVDQQDAATKFKDWAKSRWFAPKDFKKKCTSDELSGMYIPFWTFDAHAIATYSGEGGVNTVTMGKNGKSRTTTRWYPVKGIVNRSFDDIQVCATEKASDISGITPFSTIAGTKPYSPSYLSGFYAEMYTIKADAAFEIAKNEMKDELRTTAESDARSGHLMRFDRVRLNDIHPQYTDVTYKHVLLPVWSSAFYYKGKTYTYFVNGQNGNVDGSRPYSAFKIASAILGAVAVAAIILALL